MTPEPNPGIPAAVEPPPLVPAYDPMTLQPNVRNKCLNRQFIGTGAVQLVIGMLCIMFNIVSLVVSYDSVGTTGHGFWCGILFIVAGGLGIGAGKQKTKCQIIAYMAMCILSAIFTIALLTAGILGATISVTRGNRPSNYRSDCRGWCWDYPYYYPPYSNSQGYKIASAMEILLAIFGFIEAVFAIYGAAISCASGNCCCCNADPLTVFPVVYFPNNGQTLYINQTQTVQYVHPPQTMMMAYPTGHSICSDSAAQPPPYIADYTQPGWSNFPPQPLVTTDPSSA